MRKVIAVLAPLAVLGGALLLLFGLVTASPGGCPTALLQGTLVEQDGTLAIASVPDRRVVAVGWPFGYRVTREEGALTLVRVIWPVAREGDQVSVGGGEGGPGFQGCGPVTLGLSVGQQAAGARSGVEGRERLGQLVEAVDDKVRLHAVVPFGTRER
ncbi:MAG: hypothetical protein WCK58_14765 [Chloroflexota bacterium]